jgi:sugar transferase (PEP-CTERM/EpsH1 system associated)
MKLLVLTSRFPYPIEKGDKLRAYHQLRELGQRHEVVLVALTMQPVAASDFQAVAELVQQVHVWPVGRLGLIWELSKALFDGRPAQVAYFYRRHIHQKMEALIARERPDHIYCQLLRMAEYVRAESLPTTIDYMDTFSVGMKRRAQESAPWLRPLLAWEARKLARYEAAIFAHFDHHTIISEQDRQHLPVADPKRVAVIPNGIDLAFFTLPEKPPEPQHDLVFVGNMGYFPNVKAAHDLIHQIMPQVWAQRPETRVLLAGARPTAEVQRLARDPRVTVSGWIEDIRTAYLDGRIMVAPLLTGSGQQNKILEAMALARPCITTALVNNAIGASAGKEILLATDAAMFAWQLLDLLADPMRQRAIGMAGMRYVRQHFSWATSVAHLERVMARPVSTPDTSA